ncbi:MAG: N-acetylmuramoyl-L-alanine amidase [Flavobacteriales bacterium]|jgi:N-acetylmuramoyl-L-alanine amidase
MHKRILTVGLLLSLVCLAQNAMAATIESLRLWRAPDHTRIVFDLDAPISHKVMTLSSPDRIVVDIKNTRLAADLSALNLSDTPIARVRKGQQANGDLRVVFDMTAKISPRSFALRKIDDKPNRLVLDFYDKKLEKPKTIESVSQTRQNPKRDILIAIDAGHGGEDPGAVGRKKLYEKDLVLKVAKNLRNIVDATPGYKAYLVRDGDYYISLGERREKARRKKADFFVSIHADGFTKSSAHGASVFTLSQGAASSKMARALANKENRSDLIGGAGNIELDGKGLDVQKILLDLSMTRSMEVSLDVGARVLNGVGGVTKLHSSRVENAAFVVLKSFDMPSILVETGFITNPQDAKRLNTLAHRTKLAKAIFAGISSYFNSSPPEGTLVAWKKSGGGKVRYTIASGDTLSAIANRYDVSIAQIKKANKLNSSKLLIGQILYIPTI